MLLDQLDLLLDQYTIASRAHLDSLVTQSLQEFVWHVKNIRVGSPIDADQGSPPRPLPTTHTDQATQYPIAWSGLIELIWSAVVKQL